jgi:hypothetical protein
MLEEEEVPQMLDQQPAADLAVVDLVLMPMALLVPEQLIPAEAAEASEELDLAQLVLEALVL